MAFRLIDSDDISSCKLAGREAASTDALLQCCLPNLQFPLCVCVDYLGWRVLATPILPLSSSSMVSAVKFPDTCVSPSSPDRAVVVVQDSRLDALFEMVAQRLNLRRHRVSGNPASPPVWLGAHVEGHIGTDGRRCACVTLHTVMRLHRECHCCCFVSVPVLQM